MRLFIVSLFALLPVIVSAKDIKEGMPLTAARKILLAKKWRPFNIHEGKDYQYVGVEHLLIARHFKELESCAVDKPVCIFNYQRQHECLRLFTMGEEIEDMKVFEWNNECPEPEK